MFEKDIYHLIRGLRAHRGNERAYILQSLAECRREIKSPDMDAKATALLKLVYLEMFGHDMSWASFHVLEVMSSAKYAQKRVGYLAAVQSFRPETEVLMLAENLLKKDLGSADKGTIGLVVGTLPHIVDPNMAGSLLGDLLSRLSHSSPAVRKKTVVTLYRFALVYPETLRPAWPKIKERLLDEHEDPSVTAAIINVVCELGWRRPKDFLPLAPRLFELLTAGGNNWMAIKLIKLFSTLTPLEPRLVKKLLPPLTNLIKTTMAMSLLYECINGIIQGGIMEAAEGTMEGDEVARLCVNKLRAMLVVEGDPNLRYVALLAFARITTSHADLVAQHQDVILECIDDGDISIRTRALDLVVGMINANNLPSVVERLLKQLRTAGQASPASDPAKERALHEGIEPMADEDDEDMQQTIRPKESKPASAPPLPDDYRTSVIERILEMCSRDTYANMSDFEWYIGVLVELVKQCPAGPSTTGNFGSRQAPTNTGSSTVADKVGDELLNVAVRVKAVRIEAAAAAQSLLLIERRAQMFPASSSGGQGVLAAAAFIAGEYATLLPNPEAVLTSLMDPSSAQLPAYTLANYVQAVPKVMIALTNVEPSTWSNARRSNTVLLFARIIHFLEPLTLHPSLDVQERAVEYLDLMRLASEAASAQITSEESPGGYAEPPLLLTQAIPSLFTGVELNPVAPSALRKVTQPADLDLDAPINSNLQSLLQQAEYDTELEEEGTDAVYRFYNEKPALASFSSAQQRTAAEILGDASEDSRPTSYQEASPLDREVIEKRKAERRARYQDDPYYIDSERASGTSTPMHSILRNANGEDLDVDAIPVMELQIDGKDLAPASRPQQIPSTKKKPKRHFEVAADETLDTDPPESLSLPRPSSASSFPSAATPPTKSTRTKKSFLEVDSSALSTLSLTDDPITTGTASGPRSQLDVERRQQEEEEMARAIRQVERLRLEMQRRQEAVGEGDGEGVVVKRKKKPRVEKLGGGADVAGPANAGGEDGVVKKKKKKKKKAVEGEEGEKTMAAQAGGEREGEEAEGAGEAVAAKPKRKKKRQVVFENDEAGTTAA